MAAQRKSADGGRWAGSPERVLWWNATAAEFHTAAASDLYENFDIIFSRFPKLCAASQALCSMLF